MAVAQILVHAAAEETDDRARRQAAAYDSFIAERQHRLPQPAPTTRTPSPSSEHAPPRNKSHSASPPFIASSPDAAAALQSQLLTSSLASSRASSSPSPPQSPSPDRAPLTSPPLPENPSPTSPSSPVEHVLPPRAPVGLLPTSTSHVTPDLARLATLLPLATHYTPVATVTRTPKALERGHWAVDTSAWNDQALATSFWAGIASFVRNGRAGWGTSCAAEVGAVRVYCWGETVAHVYLLLYTASQSRVRRGGAVWIDADGQTAVRVAGTR